MTARRAFLARAAGAVSALGVSRALGAQDTTKLHKGSMASMDTSNLFKMDQNAARTVTLPPKPGATPSMTNDERDALEHRIRCQCGCTLDVYTCRTTDFSCQVSPAMHRDVMALVAGGHSAQEIIDAFVSAYGERALMSPKKSGFNLVGWATPGIALVVGGVAIGIMLRRWRRDARPAEVARVQHSPIDASADELARVEAAVRGDE